MPKHIARLNCPQGDFINLPHKFKAYVAGFGSGKTWVGCVGLLRHFAKNQNVNAGYFAPTYPQIRDIFYPTIEECAAKIGLSAKIRTGNHEVDIYAKKRNKMK